jgi:hypothetical protein
MQRWHILDLQALGDMPTADAEFDEYARRAEEVRLPTYRWHATVMRAMRMLMIGHLDKGERMAAEAMAMRQHGYASPAGQCYMIQQFVVSRERGRLAELDQPMTSLSRWLPALPIWRCGLAYLRAETDQVDWARALVAPFAAERFEGLPRDMNFIPALSLLAELAHQLDETRWAELLYPLLAPFADRNVIVGPSAGCYGSAARFLGMLAATLGRTDDARAHYEQALAMNARIGARMIEAYTRYDYARLLLRLDEPEARAQAAELVAAARRAADELELPRLQARVAALGNVAEPSASAAAVTEIPAGVQKSGDYWTVTFGTKALRLKDTKGMAYLATLLLNPEREFHALDLAGGAPSGGAVESARAADPDLVAGDLGDAGEMLDAEARRAYKARLVDLKEELGEAERFNDPERAAGLRAEIDALTGELARAMGLGGRSRKAGSIAERARLNVTRAIAAVQKKIVAEHPGLAEHLNATLRTGIFCSYNPDPRLRVRWRG